MVENIFIIDSRERTTRRSIRNMASRIDQAMEEVGRAREGEERGERGNRLREDKEQSQEQN